MIFFIESIVLCLIFTLMIVPKTRKDPLSQVYSYPTKIIERVKSLPEYEGKVPTNQKKWATKIIASILFVIFLGTVTYLSGMKTFYHGFWYSYGLWMVVNWYDVIVLDVILFCHDQHYRLKGTEDMVKEYESPWFHVIGGLKGCVIGFIVCILAAAFVMLLNVSL